MISRKRSAKESVLRMLRKGDAALVRGEGEFVYGFR